jgi:hypothetical protein
MPDVLLRGLPDWAVEALRREAAARGMTPAQVVTGLTELLIALEGPGRSDAERALLHRYGLGRRDEAASQG